MSCSTYLIFQIHICTIIHTCQIFVSVCYFSKISCSFVQVSTQERLIDTTTSSCFETFLKLFCYFESFGKCSVKKYGSVICQSIFNQCSAYVETRQLDFSSKMFEKHLWKSDILSKDAGVFQNFASKNQLPGLSVRATLVENYCKDITSLNQNFSLEKFTNLSEKLKHYKQLLLDKKTITTAKIWTFIHQVFKESFKLKRGKNNYLKFLK